MSRIRVVQVVDRLEPCGVTELVRQLALNLPSARFENAVWAVRAAGASDIDPAREAEGGARLAACGIATATVELGADASLPRRVGALGRSLGAGRFDVVHAHSRPADWWCALAAPLAGVPVRLYSRQATYGAFSRGTRLRYAVAARLCDRVVAVSGAVERHLLERESAPRARVERIYDAIDLASVAAAAPWERTRARLGLGPRRPVVGVVAALTPRKGHRFLLEAVPSVLAAHPDAIFVVVGDGPEREALEARTRALGCAGAVRFLGTRADAIDLTAALDVFVLPSLWEGFNLSLLTACALGRAVVASNVGSCPEIVIHGETGLLPTPRAHALEAEALDPGALAGAISALLADRALRARLGAAARERVVARFGAAEMGARHAALYEHLLARKLRAPWRSRLGAAREPA